MSASRAHSHGKHCDVSKARCRGQYVSYPSNLFRDCKCCNILRASLHFLPIMTIGNTFSQTVMILKDLNIVCWANIVILTIYMPRIFFSSQVLVLKGLVKIYHKKKLAIRVFWLFPSGTKCYKLPLSKFGRKQPILALKRQLGAIRQKKRNLC